ncbi:MAG: hypothetical protein ABI539_14360 [Acidobacteriota bacterium]
MRPLFLLIIFIVLLAGGSVVFSRDPLTDLVDTEKAFAATAADKGTKTAFLEYSSADALLFLPEKINSRSYWTSRDDSKGLLSWAPNYADLSANGLIGYTTGNWEFRPGSKDAEPTGFGQFVTIWQRQPDGKYRFVVDIGVGHAKPGKFSNDLLPPAYPSKGNPDNSSAADNAAQFFEIAGKFGTAEAYKRFAAEKVRVFREGEMPVIGKKALLSKVKKEMPNVIFAKRSVFFGSDDIAYIQNSYSVSRQDGSVEKGNFVHIWKLIDGRWQIVLDIFKPVPQK